MLRLSLPLALLLTAFATACSSPGGGQPSSSASTDGRQGQAAAAPAAGEWFTDRAQESGIDFVHFNGMTGKFYQPEIMGPGVALFDFDNDGDLDVYLVQGTQLGTGTPLIAPPAAGLGDRLYRNDLQVAADGAHTVRFTDVTAQSGIRPRGYGMGVAAGDIDNDGYVDLYLTGFGRNQLFHNNGNGTFTDVSKASGTDDPVSWGVSATFFDYDRDGLLDLFVGNYLNYTLQTHTPCFGPSGAPDYCRPEVYGAQPNRLYHNAGGGRFVDVTIASGVARAFGPALGCVAADLNNDGWPDLFVTNDEQENQLWINQKDGTFVNTALAAGVALGASGERKANMGVDAGDFDADGDEDLFVTELISQGSSLWVNDGTATFEELSARLGIRGPSLPYTGFGTSWIDVDNDGWLDILAVNGDVNQNVKTLSRKDDPFPMGQRKQLFRNVGGRFDDVSALAGKVFDLVEAGRGAAFGDIDNDGDTDVLVANGAGRMRLLINNVGSRQHWVGLRLVSPGLKRDAVGARIEVQRASGPLLVRHAHADGSYASANDPRVLVGLGASADPVRVRVRWPDGNTEEWSAVPTDRYTTLTQGASR
ncbi:MAG: CRTAC1 family protein [Acidobacteria bacterium]|nr:CRTAC1 family protein [Acidobacteriota bacterium]